MLRTLFRKHNPLSLRNITRNGNGSYPLQSSSLFTLSTKKKMITPLSNLACFSTNNYEDEYSSSEYETPSSPEETRKETEIDWKAIFGDFVDEEELLYAKPGARTRDAPHISIQEALDSNSELSQISNSILFGKDELSIMATKRIGFPRLSEESRTCELFQDIVEESVDVSLQHAKTISSLLQLNMNDVEYYHLMIRLSQFIYTYKLSENSRSMLFDTFRNTMEDNRDAEQVIALFQMNFTEGESSSFYISPFISKKEEQMDLLYSARLRCNSSNIGITSTIGSLPNGHSSNPSSNYSPMETFADVYEETLALHDLIATRLCSSSQCDFYAMLRHYHRGQKKMQSKPIQVLSTIMEGFDGSDCKNVLPHVYDYLSRGQEEFSFDMPLMVTTKFVKRRDRRRIYLQTIMEARMRTSHIAVSGIDTFMGTFHQPLNSVILEEKCVALAWNLVNGLSPRTYQAFHNRFFRFKTLVRGNKSASEVFLRDTSRALGYTFSPVFMDHIEELRDDLTLDRLHKAWCKEQFEPYKRPHLQVSVQLKKKKDKAPVSVLLEEASIFLDDESSSVLSDDEMNSSLSSYSQESESLSKEPPTGASSPTADSSSPPFSSSSCVFYANVPENMSSEQLKTSLYPIGVVKNVMFFEKPPEKIIHWGQLKHRGSKPITKSKDKQKLVMHHMDSHSICCALVEYENPADCQVALDPAVRIFGIVVRSKTDLRPMFGYSPEPYTTIILKDIAFGRTMGSVIAQIQSHLLDKKVELVPDYSEIPEYGFITNGELQLTFPSFDDAALVAHGIDTMLGTLEVRENGKDSGKKKGDKEQEGINNLGLVQDQVSRGPHERPFKMAWDFPESSRRYNKEYEKFVDF